MQIIIINNEEYKINVSIIAKSDILQAYLGEKWINKRLPIILEHPYLSITNKDIIQTFEFVDKFKH